MLSVEPINFRDKLINSRQSYLPLFCFALPGNALDLDWLTKAVEPFRIFDCKYLANVKNNEAVIHPFDAVCRCNQS